MRLRQAFFDSVCFIFDLSLFSGKFTSKRPNSGSKLEMQRVEIIEDNGSFCKDTYAGIEMTAAAEEVHH